MTRRLVMSPAVALLCLATFGAPRIAGADETDSGELKRGFDAIEAWRIDEAREIAERWIRRAPEHPLVLALTAEVKLHMSDYAGAVSYFDRAEKAGAPITHLQNASLAQKAAAATKGYVEEVSDHFIVRYSPGKDAILVPYAIETLEAARDKIGKLLGWTPPTRIVVEFYPTAATLADVSSLTRKEIETSGTIALCKWNRLMVTTPRAIVFGYSWRDTVAHELAHLIIGGASKNTAPIWLHEGIAKFVETAWRDKPGLGLSVQQQTMLKNAAKKNTLIPFARMHPSMAKLKSQEETALAFAEVFTFIEYMVEQKGWDAIRDVFRKMSDGLSEESAVEQVFGTSLETLSGRWMAKLKTREVKREGVQLQTDRELVVKDRPDAPDDNLHGVSKTGRRYARAADLLYARGRLKAAQKELEKAYQETRSPLISSKLAMVALATGDLDSAETAARQAIDGTHDLPGPSVTLAEILVRRGKPAEARTALDRAIALNPFDPRIHSLTLASAADKDAMAKRNAELALRILSGQVSIRPPVLGTGGKVEIEGVPFSRVYVERDTAEGSLQLPTGMITPTTPLSLKPGTLKLRLVPPIGPPIVRTVTVEPKDDSAAPQRISPDMEGS